MHALGNTNVRLTNRTLWLFLKRIKDAFRKGFGYIYKIYYIYAFMNPCQGSVNAYILTPNCHVMDKKSTFHQTLWLFGQIKTSNKKMFWGSQGCKNKSVKSLKWRPNKFGLKKDYFFVHPNSGSLSRNAIKNNHLFTKYTLPKKEASSLH